MPKDDQVYIGHMLDTALQAVSKVRGKTRADYDADENLRLALTHLVQTIGEACRRVSQPFQQQHPEVPWAKIVGMRHRVVHDYLHVDFDIVWNVVTVNLPSLVDQLESVLSSPPE